MSPFRYYWRALVLALVPLLAFTVSYYELFESKRLNSVGGYNYFWLLGSCLPVGVISGSLLYGMSDSPSRTRVKRHVITWAGAFVIGAVYLYALFFVVLNTMGS
jgi:hypothetical protein